MVCPLLPIVGVGAVVGGTHTILIQDRSRRRTAWFVLLALSGGWALYATVLRLDLVRIVLESSSMLALVAGGYRAWWLARHRGVRSPLLARLLPLGRYLVACVRSPLVLVANVWLAAMLTIEWRGKAHFSGLEYALVCLVLAAAVSLRTRSLTRSRRADHPMHALESFREAAPSAACPLGFGSAEPSPAQQDRTMSTARTGDASTPPPDPGPGTRK